MLTNARPSPEDHDGPAGASGENPKGRTAYIETYGCQMNLADSELISRILVEAGYILVDTPDQADVILVNTCAVREHAEQRVLGRLRQLVGLRRGHPHLRMGILGCMAQHLGPDLLRKAPFLNVVAGPDAYRRLPDLLAGSPTSTAGIDVRLNRHETYADLFPLNTGGRINAWIPVIRGCDRFCTFCIVPFVRGRERCVSPEHVLQQVRRTVEAHYPQVTLLGQTVNAYQYGDMTFAGLLRQVAEVPGLKRVRFVSPYPAHFDTETISVMASEPTICHALHLPVQSGSDAQLARMGRGYTVDEFRDLVHRLRMAMPDLTLSTDIITGFCGETEEDFSATMSLLREIRFDSAFMFKYSERPGTRAHKTLADDVPESVKIARLEQIISLQEGISAQINQEVVGRTVDVLVEGPSRRGQDRKAGFYGRTKGGKVVVFEQPAPGGSLRRIRIREATSHTLFGDAVEEAVRES